MMVKSSLAMPPVAFKVFQTSAGLVGKNSFYVLFDTAWPPPRGSGTIKDSYAVCSVTGTQFVGGFVGDNETGGTIHNCYCVSQVAGESDMGGLVGSSKGNVISAFWDIQTSGQTTSAGGTGKTTAEMQMESTFTDAGWDFVGESVNGTEDIWWILEGQDYSRMWWQLLALPPDPHNGAVNVNQRLILNWFAGVSAMHHDIYFGEDEEAVANATTESTGIYRGRQVADVTTYAPGILEWSKTYYWRIDEVNEADPNSPWVGDVWSFTTANFLVVDDFEDYNDWPLNEIWYTWIDGYGIPENGATLCYDLVVEPFAFEDVVLAAGDYVETSIVHGGDQAMPFCYSNTFGAAYSEVERTFAVPQNWTAAGVQTLVLYFHGSPGNTGQLYVKVNGSKVVYDGDAADIVRPQWKQWNIDLASLGVDLQNVTTLSIGIDGSGAGGTLYFDDIRLYRPPELEP